jgi:FKBP-type peptidyl-prolyl cis-trans isomerase
MKRSLVGPLVAAPALAAVAIIAVLLAGCGNAAAPQAAAPAPVATAVAQPAPPGVPALTGNPTDLTQPVTAQAGTGTAPAGLVTQDLVLGSGPKATTADTVSVRYSGSFFADGKPFDSSWSKGSDPISFPLGNVVKGFSQGIAGMQPGGRRLLVIPPALGYGDKPRGPIPGGSTLVFVVDLVKIG